MASPKPDADDVILYMDALPASNGLGGPPELDEESFARESIESTLEGAAAAATDGKRHLETDHPGRDNNNHRREEIDDLEPETAFHGKREHYPGIDDGLLDTDDDEKPMPPPSPRLRPSDFPSFSGAEALTPTPDMNVYQQKKTIAQGMMDLALISANANQFRYVLQSSGRHPYYYPSLAMIGLSLFLQVVVGIGLIWNSRYNVKVDDQMCKANRANNWTVIAIFLVTILNVFISSFGVVESTDIFTSSATT